MARVFKRIDCKSARNLAIFWAVHRDGRTQDEVAAQYGITQQRVSAIIGEAAKFVALAPSEEYEKIPQMGQLQFAYRIQLEKLKQRRRNVALAFEKSMEGVTSVKNLDTGKQVSGEGAKGSFTQWKKESSAKSQHGDWRLDRQLGLIDREIIDSTVELYGRDWLGWDQLEKAGMEPRRKRRKGGGRKAEVPMRNAESGRRNEGEASEVESVVDRVACPTAVARACELPTDVAVSVAASSEPQHALPDGVGHGTPVVAAAVPPSVLVPPPSCESAIASAKPAKRPHVPPISKLTGKLIDGPRQQSPEFLRMHGLDPEDYGGGNVFDTTPVWMTGPNPREVLSRNTALMTPEEYRQHQADLATMRAIGSWPGTDLSKCPPPSSEARKR